MPLTQIPNAPVTIQDNILGKQPSIWYGITALDGTIAPFTNVGIGSIYVCNASAAGTVTVYYKRLAANETASWATFGTA